MDKKGSKGMKKRASDRRRMSIDRLGSSNYDDALRSNNNSNKPMASKIPFSSTAKDTDDGFKSPEKENLEMGNSTTSLDLSPIMKAPSTPEPPTQSQESQKLSNYDPVSEDGDWKYQESTIEASFTSCCTELFSIGREAHENNRKIHSELEDIHNALHARKVRVKEQAMNNKEILERLHAQF